ncbi:hypothetical protein DL96DRAFT_686321 [Flagelloscypha sp. PMI_526]|nr:hypothetical protein DL96DRAFT_686321 [Flagelloscypha sp. PMI_526]
MVQLPLDIWELILVLIPPKEVHRLRSLNASFLSKALDFRYSTVRFDTLPSWTSNRLAMTSKLRLSAQVARLLDPFITPRIRSLHIATGACESYGPTPLARNLNILLRHIKTLKELNIIYESNYTSAIDLLWKNNATTLANLDITFIARTFIERADQSVKMPGLKKLGVHFPSNLGIGQDQINTVLKTLFRQVVPHDLLHLGLSGITGHDAKSLVSERFPSLRSLFCEGWTSWNLGAGINLFDTVQRHHSNLDSLSILDWNHYRRDQEWGIVLRPLANTRISELNLSDSILGDPTDISVLAKTLSGWSALRTFHLIPPMMSVNSWTYLGPEELDRILNALSQLPQLHSVTLHCGEVTGEALAKIFVALPLTVDVINLSFHPPSSPLPDGVSKLCFSILCDMNFVFAKGLTSRVTKLDQWFDKLDMHPSSHKKREEISRIFIRHIDWEKTRAELERRKKLPRSYEPFI